MQYLKPVTNDELNQLPKDTKVLAFAVDDANLAKVIEALAGQPGTTLGAVQTALSGQRTSD